MRRTPWLVATLVATGTLLAWPTFRDALLFRNALGADLPFYLYTLCAWLPLALVWRARPNQDRTELAARRRLALVPAALYTLIFVELVLDPTLTRWLGLDFTGAFIAIEGGFYPGLQDALRQPGPWLDHIATYLYAYGYVVVYGVVPAWAVLLSPLPLARRILHSLCLVWVVGLASFLLFPVNEPWTTSDAIENVLFHRIATAQDHFLLQWAVNNEFPSMHVATTFAVAYPLWRDSRRAFAWLSPVVLTMPIVVVYLGIHWVLDAVFGVALGLAGGMLAYRDRPAAIARAFENAVRPKD